MYGLISTEAAYNAYIHYFTRTEEGFHYLGRFPVLHYDNESGQFIGYARVEEKTYTFYYTLDGHQLTQSQAL